MESMEGLLQLHRKKNIFYKTLNIFIKYIYMERVVLEPSILHPSIKNYSIYILKTDI